MVSDEHLALNYLAAAIQPFMPTPRKPSVSLTAVDVRIMMSSDQAHAGPAA